LVNLDDSADHDGPADEHMPPSSSNPACNTARDTVYSDSIFGPTQAPNPVSPDFSPFCQHGLHRALDSHRHKGKNTHELIVLPAIRQVLPADPAMRQNRLLGGMLWLAGSVAVHYLPTAKAASPASRIYLGAGAIRRSLGPGTSNPFYRTPFDPDQNIHGRPNAKRLPEDLTAR
jgi:hypothetical protein